MPQPLLFNAFEMLVPSHQSPGLWRHPADQGRRYNELDYWVQLVQELEAGGFHGIFFADILGQYDVHGGSADAAVRAGVQYPQLDPTLLISALAQATTRIGFGVTASVTYEHPYLLARRFSTLDHLTGGRIGWNIVTSYQDSAARNLGLDAQIPHDQRYDRAEEYMDVVYKLWEGSIEEDAISADAGANVFTDPDKVHGIGHDGAVFQVPGPALVAPSAQRTPLLFQAGASARGREFAARHAEAIFFSGYTPEMTRGWVNGVRDGLESSGRARDAVKVFAMATVITADTDEAAQQKFDEYAAYIDPEAALALFAGWTGVDLSTADLDAPLEYIRTEGNQSALAAFTTLDPSRTWTVRELARFIGIGGRGPVIIGSPRTVSDELERWRDAADIDGFNLSSAVRPADLVDFARLVCPELRRRGLLDEAPAGATFRRAISGSSDRLATDHQGARFRQSAGAATVSG